MVAVDVARDQPVAQEQERRLRDVGQAVVPQLFDLAGEEQPLDLAPVDAVLPGSPITRAAPSSDVIFAAP